MDRWGAVVKMCCGNGSRFYGTLFFRHKKIVMTTNQVPFTTLINSDKPVLVDFFAEWCGPCRMMPPILHELKSGLGEKVTIIKIDVDRNSRLAEQYQVQGVPTLMVFKKGKLEWRQSGVVPAKKLQAVIQQYW
jgi:thioredoxin 1